MMRCLFFVLAILVLLLPEKCALAQVPNQCALGQWVLHQNDEGFLEISERVSKQENPRLVAIALDLTLGLFGMHRLYLGTSVQIPVAYTLTFGGGGILWLVDLALLVGSPSIESYKNNPHLFMWIPPAKTLR
jgi:TM2 domain-containing membrane protein YozV